MSKLIQFFLWTCTSMLLGLMAIIGMAAAKGNFDRDTLVKIVALLSGIDIQGDRLAAAIQSGKAAPVPTYDEVLDAKVKALLQSDSRSAALDRYKKELDDRAKRLQEESDRHNALVAEFKKTVAQAEEARQTESQQQIREILEALDPAAAKQQLVAMLEKEQKAEVISIMKALDADKLKKILAEFADLADQQKISEILEEIRVRGMGTDTTPPKAP
ncbi:hypothetical protein SH467x_001848 [Pirellulaceae bacterium SH467]